MTKVPDIGSAFFLFIAFSVAVFFYQAPQYANASAPAGEAEVVLVQETAPGEVQGDMLTESERAMMAENPAMLQPGGDVSTALLVIIAVAFVVLIILAIILITSDSFVFIKR